MAFQGSLAELHLPDIIQLVSVSGKSGVFHLSDGGHRGNIWLQEGRIVHAEHEDLWGEDAVYALAIWRSGEFRFEAGTTAPRQTIQKSNTNLLMEAARRLDEWRVLSKKIPSVDLVPEFVILENREGQINLNTMEWLLLSKIDGQRSVRQIAGAAGMGVFDAAKLLYGLVATNLIRLKEKGAAPAAASTAPAAPAGRSPAPPRGAPAPGGAAGSTSTAGPHPAREAARRVRGPSRAGRRDRRAEALHARAGRDRARRRAGGHRGGHPADRPRRRHPEGQRRRRRRAQAAEGPLDPRACPGLVGTRGTSKAPRGASQESPAESRPPAAAAIIARQRASTASQRYSAST